jgi:Acyl-CoA dehydrogenase, C-terminal domain
VTVPPVDIAGDEYVTLAARAMRTSDGVGALDSLGWWDLLADLGETDARTAVFAVFRAQGRELVSSPALGGLLAQPYVEAAGLEPGTVVATVPRASARGRPVLVAVGDVTDRMLLVDRPGEGAAVAEPDAVVLRPVHLPGRLALHEVDIGRSRAAATVDEARARAARERSAFLGRVALALEIVGAAEGALALAVDHATHREQFGQPIGRFQAVRHLLAWARTDCVAIEAVARQAVTLYSAAPPRYGEVVKALAGRNGRRACERTLQVLGGIGFTAEHDHHHHHARVLALDALLGTSAALVPPLGAWLRSTDADPGLASTVLLGGPLR